MSRSVAAPPLIRAPGSSVGAGLAASPGLLELRAPVYGRVRSQSRGNIAVLRADVLGRTRRPPPRGTNPFKKRPHPGWGRMRPSGVGARERARTPDRYVRLMEAHGGRAMEVAIETRRTRVCPAIAAAVATRARVARVALPRGAGLSVQLDAAGTGCGGHAGERAPDQRAARSSTQAVRSSSASGERADPKAGMSLRPFVSTLTTESWVSLAVKGGPPCVPPLPLSP